jgi:hypothetical protein
VERSSVKLEPAWQVKQLPGREKSRAPGFLPWSIRRLV